MLIKRLNYNHLFNFYLIGKYSSLSEAARIQGVSKPSLSAQIKKLEQSLGVILFSRKSHRMKLTYDGQKIYDYASQMFELSDAMLKSLATKTRSSDKTITLGITPTISRYYSLVALAPILKSTTFIPIIREGNYEYLMEELLKNNLDIIINEEQISITDSPGVTTQPIGFNKYVIVGIKKYSHLSNNFPSSLSDESFFSYTSSNPVRAKIDQFFFNHDISVNLFGEADSIEVIKEATMRGYCVAALPEWTTKEGPSETPLITIGAIEGGIEKINATYVSNDNAEKVKKILDILMDASEMPR